MQLWQPPKELIEYSRMTHFRRWLENKLAKKLPSYEALHDFSVHEQEVFWSYVWDYFDIIGDKGKAPYLQQAKDIKKTRYFPKAHLNYVENIFTKAQADKIAIIFRNEDGQRIEISFSDLRKQVENLAYFCHVNNDAEQTRICAVLPNIPQAVVSMLASAANGSIFSSCSPDFGLQALIHRFSQINPEILVCCEAYQYHGRIFDISERMQKLVKALPSVKKIVIVTCVDEGVALDLYTSFHKTYETVHYKDIISYSPEKPYIYKRYAFNSALYILFSSGTTGIPKCIVHSMGGILMKHLLEHALHTNLSVKDRLFYYTTTGWMMWNWLVGSLVNATTIVLYDGSPSINGVNTLFDIIDEEKVTVFGTSAKYIDYLSKNKAMPIKTHKLDTLETILSTGSVLSADGFVYVYNCVKETVLLSSISGGTDICGCFVAGNPLLPVNSAEIQCAVLGMATKVFNAKGEAVCNEKGELVCDKPFPSMPLYFWNDPSDMKYEKAYFDRFKNVWCHGDYAVQTEKGGFIILGRSDATLNPGGVRIGTAEIYTIVENLQDIREAVVVGQEWDGDTRIILFVIMQQGYVLDDDCQNRIRQNIKEHASPRHVPARIIVVDDIPRTRSGKISEIVVRDLIHNRPIHNLDAIANPDVLAQYQNMDQLKT